MKVLSVVPSYYPAKIYGGTIFSIHETNQEICKSNKNIKIDVLTTTANGRVRLKNKKNKLIRYLKNYSVFYCHDEIINRFSLSFIFKLQNKIKESDILHLQDIFSYFAILTVFFSYFYNKKIIISPRGSLSEWSLKSKYFILKKLIFLFIIKIKKNIFWHVTSNLEKNDLKKLGIKENIRVIENFAFKPSFIKIKKKWWIQKLDKKKIALGFLGRMDKKKRVDLLLNSFCKANTNNLTLSIAGIEKKQMNTIVREKKYLNKRVYFLSYLDKTKYNYLSSLDYFIMLSENENFGNVYLESLVSGTPIITSKFTPFKNVANFSSGHVLDLNENKIINFLKKLDQNKIKKIKVSRKYISQFNKKNIIFKFYSFYREIEQKI